MQTTNVVDAVFNGARTARTRGLYQYDYGQVLRFADLSVPSAYQVHFSNVSVGGEAVTQIGGADGVTIPDALLTTGKPVYAWVFLHTGADDGETRYTVYIPVTARSKATDVEPTPVQQGAIDQAIAALNAAVEQTAADVETTGENVTLAQAAQEQAESYAQNASQSAQNSAQSATQAGNEAVNANTYANTAMGYAGQAAQSATDAEDSAVNAAGSAAVAGQSASSAAQSAEAAQDAVENVQSTIDAALAEAKASGEFDGADGFSPIARVEQTATGATVTITDKDGMTTAEISNGPQGETGDTGATPDLTIGTVETLEPGEDATATITGTPENPVLNISIPRGNPGEVTEDELQAALLDKADVIVANAAGAVASFTDGAAMPVKSMVIDIEPVQDLHGYDHPWPAGGGVNKMPPGQVKSGTVNGLTYTSDGNGRYTIKGTATARSTISFDMVETSQLIADGKLSLFNTDTGVNLFFRFNGSDATYWAMSVQNRTVTVNEAYAKIFDQIAIIVDSGKTIDLSFAPMIYEGDTATSFSLYSNICPIAGWDSVEFSMTGGNLLPTFTTAPTVSRLIISVDNGKITISGTVQNTITIHAPVGDFVWDGVQDAWLSGCPSGGNYDSGYSLRVDGLNSGNFSKPDTGNGTRLTGYSPTNIIKNMPLKFAIVLRPGTYKNLTFAPMLNFGNVALPYEEYKGTQTYSIAFPASAGTVYGGTLDVTNGKLIVDRAEVDLGTLSWTTRKTENIHKGLSTDIPYKYIVAGNLPPFMAERYAIIGYTNGATLINDGVDNKETGIYGFTGGSSATVTTIYAVMQVDETAPSGALVYELAAPIVYDVDPVTIRTLLGVNNIWADTGDVAVDYRADTKLYIDGKIAALLTQLEGN